MIAAQQSTGTVQSVKLHLMQTHTHPTPVGTFDQSSGTEVCEVFEHVFVADKCAAVESALGVVFVVAVLVGAGEAEVVGEVPF